MLAEAVGDFGDVALVGANRREIVGLADEVKRPQGFPNLLGAGIDSGDFRANIYAGSARYGK